MSYPPIDPEFYRIGAESGMTDADIQADWDAYCSDLETFHRELDAAAKAVAPEERAALNDELAAIQKELDEAPLPVKHGMQPLLDDLKNLFKEPNQNG